MAHLDRTPPAGPWRDSGGPGGAAPVCYSFTACVRCPMPEERLLGGLRPPARAPSIRVQPRRPGPGPGGKG